MITACPICKTLSFSRALCSECAGHLHARLDPVAREEKEFTIYSLFAWERDQWPGLSRWIYALKQKEHARFWREPAVWALELFPLPRKPVTWVPVPSSRRQNHAQGFARGLSHWAGGKVADELTLMKTGEGEAQKRLSRGARAQRQFEWIRSASQPDPSNWPKPLPSRKWILVDDVVTTGATARAAYHALGRPRGFQVWCLADRRPCGDRGALL